MSYVLIKCEPPTAHAWPVSTPKYNTVLMPGAFKAGDMEIVPDDDWHAYVLRVGNQTHNLLWRVVAKSGNYNELSAIRKVAR